MKVSIYIYVLIFSFSFLQLQAQDPIFSQFFVTPMQTNPAFAGNTLAPRITASYRNQWQWAAPINVYTTYGVSYGQFFEPLNSSIGLMLETDNAGEGIYKVNRFSAMYGYRLQLNKEVFVKFGLEGGITQSNLNWDKLIFLDQLDPIEGAINPSDELRPGSISTIYGTVGAGILAYGKNFYAGFGAKHLNTPDEAVLGISDNLNTGLPMRLALQAGAQFTLKEGNNKQAGSFVSPNIMLVKQGDFGQVNAGAYVGYGAFFGGLWYRHAWTNSDAAIFLVGLEYDIFKIGYSYDFTISGLASSSGGTAGTSEITLVLNFENSSDFKRRRRSSRYNDCMKIFR